MSRDEQELLISWGAKDDTAEVWSTERGWKIKIRALAEKHGLELREDGDAVSVRVPPSALYVTIRKPRTMSKKQRAAAIERLAKARKEKTA